MLGKVRDMKNSIALLILGIMMMIPATAVVLAYLSLTILVVAIYYNVIFGGLLVLLACLKIIRIRINKKIERLDD